MTIAADSVMKRLTVFCLILVGMVVQSCRTCHCLNTSVSEKNDSVRIVEITYTEIIRDTTYVEVPVEVKSVVINDSVSTLETQFAISRAEITEDGHLKHSLENKPRSIPVEVESKVEHKNVEKTEINSDVQTVTNTEYIEREYTWWDKTRFYVLYVIVLAFLVKYGKQIIKIVRKLFL